MGQLALQQKDVKAAEAYVKRLADIEPDEANTYYQKGLLKLAEKKPGEASALFEKALNLNPDFEAALFQRLTIDMRKNRVEDAIKRCLEQVRFRPDNYRYRVLLGRLYGAQKDYKNAIGSFEKALALKPESQDALFGLARMEQATGSN